MAEVVGISVRIQRGTVIVGIEIPTSFHLPGSHTPHAILVAVHFDIPEFVRSVRFDFRIAVISPVVGGDHTRQALALLVAVPPLRFLHILIFNRLEQLNRGNRTP